MWRPEGPIVRRPGRQAGIWAAIDGFAVGADDRADDRADGLLESENADGGLGALGQSAGDAAMRLLAGSTIFFS
jgi:hypothetical protein